MTASDVYRLLVEAQRESADRFAAQVHAIAEELAADRDGQQRRAENAERRLAQFDLALRAVVEHGPPLDLWDSQWAAGLVRDALASDHQSQAASLGEEVA